ncbi:unnamed protein product [Linum tenue]|uniref:DUF6821 domain-containing protein n=1 Tax=Linum tenue TaxID=586396 RepID=A0AAV0RPN9_9ROSI|nr:unnamed protein product [Linum tenue]
MEFDQLVSDLLSCEAKCESGLEENVKSRQLGFEEIEQKEVMSDEATRGGNAPWRRTRVLLKLGTGNRMVTFAMAAAVMGFVIFGRKLYKMKRKARSLELKVTLDDKVSQFMSRAARLNEAFSVVRWVPIVRPMLPAAGVNP